MGQRRESVKNLIKLFQPISQEEKLARLAAVPPEATSPTKSTTTSARNGNASARFVSQCSIGAQQMRLPLVSALRLLSSRYWI